ncbi:MAG: hypothetical protein AB7S80_05220 [Rhizobiaceae bacterium]
MRGMLLVAIALAGVLAQGQLAAASSAGRCGGGGGQKTKTLTCPKGQYIVGVAARGGAFVDEISVACQKIPTSGEPGPRGAFRSAGTGGGTDARSGFCRAAQAVMELSTKGGAYLDRVKVASCNPRRNTGAWETVGINSSVSLNIGGLGGTDCTIECPAGEALYELTVKYGGWIDSIRGQCRQ